jgi:hypothetical protein
LNPTSTDGDAMLLVNGQPVAITEQHSLRFEIRQGRPIPILLLNNEPVAGQIRLVLRIGKL